MEFRMKRSVEAFGLRWSRTRERGATAVVIALTLVLVMGGAAFAFDSTNLALQRQTLRNLTDAAAQAGAAYLRDSPSDPAGARQAVLNYALQYDPTFTPVVTLWCMVPSTGSTKAVAPGNIPALCNPGGSGTYLNGVGGVVCDTNLCAIPCPLSGATCNAVKVDSHKDVPFYFAPAIGINSGSTGAVTSVSCAKSCGSGGTPNPLDVAIIADRTPSMSNSDFSAMQSGIAASLATMTPEYQLATLGTIHRSNAKPTDSCQTSLGPQATTTTTTTGSGSHKTTTTTYQDGGARVGSWMPLGFSNNYLTGSLGSAGRTLITSSGLGYQVNCMNHYDSSSSTGYPWGTHLAAPLKAAARMLLNPTLSNLGTLSAQRQALLTSGSTVKQWIIFETDGYPEETMGLNSTSYNPAYKDSTAGTNNTDLSSSIEPSAPGNTTQGCQNLLDVASHAKTAGINIIMIAFGTGTTNSCGGSLGNVRDVMAKAASNYNGSPSKNPSSCTGANTDGDYFFCAATGADLQSIFKTAIGQASSANTKFVKMPGS